VLSSIPLSAKMTTKHLVIDTNFTLPVQAIISGTLAADLLVMHPLLASPLSHIEPVDVYATIAALLSASTSVAVDLPIVTTAQAGAIGLLIPNVSVGSLELVVSAASIVDAEAGPVRLSDSQLAEGAEFLNEALPDMNAWIAEYARSIATQAAQQVESYGSVDDLGSCLLALVCYITAGCQSEAAFYFALRVRNWALIVLLLLTLLLTLLLVATVALCRRFRCMRRCRCKKAADANAAKVITDPESLRARIRRHATAPSVVREHGAADPPAAVPPWVGWSNKRHSSTSFRRLREEHIPQATTLDLGEYAAPS